MSKKYLHVKDGIVKAVTLEGEKTTSYGEVIEVAVESEVGVGDAYPAVEAKKAKAK